MSLRKTYFVICQVLSILCLASGYGIVGHWIGTAIALLTGFAWLLARINPASGLSLICLLASVGLAAAGVLTGSPPLLMISGSGFSLATWDLLLLEPALGSNVSGEQTKRYESKHLQSLALALGSGFILTFLGRFLNLQIPFIVLLLFVSLVIFGLDRIWGYIKKRSHLPG